GDGWLDIYICRAGWFDDPAGRTNRLFINNQDGTFTDKAQELGVANSNFSMQSSFFDYDKDGDLDLYVMNAGKDIVLTKRAVSLADVRRDPGFRDFAAYDVLYRNDGAAGFKDVSAEAGIQTDIGFGLGLATADFNQDGWTDIYVGNDFIAPDYLYINQGDGTFKEVSKAYFKHTTFYSMGTDVGDINNDGFADLFVLDMLPEDYKRSKTTMEMVNPKNFNQLVDWEYNYQYMHNMLHLNTGQGVFTEVSQLAGVNKSDWSWSVLLADLDNDQYRDIFITNGIYRNMTEQDLRARVQEEVNQKQRRLRPTEILELAGSTKIPNYAFRNMGDLTFQKTFEEWGFDVPTFSNGSALADLDQDGDLDIVINNLNDPAFIYENQATKNGNHYLGFRFDPTERRLVENLKINLKDEAGTVQQTHELVGTRGFFSSSEPIVLFGLGTQSSVATVEVIWPSGKMQVLNNVKADQYFDLKSSDAQQNYQKPRASGVAFEAISNQLSPVFVHKENDHFDFYPQILLPHQQSQNGPFLSVGDVNGDDLDDFFVGGAMGQAGALYLQQPDGSLQFKNTPAFTADQQYEDMGNLLFDADGDQDLDLYVVSGGFEHPIDDPNYQDRLYLNDGQGNFTRAQNALPQLTASGSCVKGADYDKDGDIDLFVGGRVVPDKYPFPPQSYLLENEGGTF
ncbi:MAG: VCBS repeat-containing protein, partial [Phaeodactylibacter sp.]|nr:VCBS repeat-containing protein [Phaeodactylibacter sp.]